MKPNALKQLPSTPPEQPPKEGAPEAADELAVLRRRIERLEKHGRARGWSFED